jgi:hypothetical protein
MNWWLVYLFILGFAGSGAVELVRLYRLLLAGRKFPTCYTTRWKIYVPIRIGIALFGGWLVLIYGVESQILALQIGASTPSIVETVFRAPEDLP